MIRPAGPGDAGAVAHIYNYYIANTVVTFEEGAVSPRDMRGRIATSITSDLPWLVAEDDAGDVVGYAYASQWQGRCAYRFAVEVTVYLSDAATSRGWGSRLYDALFSDLRNKSMHVVIGGIALPNPASVALHEKFGMEKVAHFREVGFKFGHWVDVGYWQGMLND